MKTLLEAISEWMGSYKINSVKPTTYDRLVTSLNSLKNYPISNIDISDLTVKDIQTYVNSMVSDGYSLSTIKKQFHLIGAFLKFANIEGVIQKPIQNNVRIPSQSSVKKKKKEVEAYSSYEQESLKKILWTLERTGYGTAILMMETGLRVGEALALTWNDILWDRKAIRINKTLIRIANRKQMVVQDGAKSYSSNRTIPLNSKAIELLSLFKTRASNESVYIFEACDGRPISYEALRYQIQHACLLAKVPYKGQHVFRHTFATNCYNRGCDVKILSKLLGHSDVTITYNVYIHLFGDALEEMRIVIG